MLVADEVFKTVTFRDVRCLYNDNISLAVHDVRIRDTKIFADNVRQSGRM